MSVYVYVYIIRSLYSYIYLSKLEGYKNYITYQKLVVPFKNWLY